MEPKSFLSLATITLGVSCALLPAPAAATQPLEEFLAGAKTHNFDARVAKVNQEQRSLERKAALGKLLPSFSARGTYTRNQFEIAANLPTTQGQPPVRLLITPQNQFDANLSIDVPIVDLATYHRYKQAKHLSAAADAQQELTGFSAEGQVAANYYQFLGASALLEAAKENQRISQENADLVAARREAGVATDLDLERAKASVEQTKQNVADAELAVQLNSRNLQTLTGLWPTKATEYPEDDLHTEGDLNAWLGVRETPTDRVARKMEEASTSGKRAAAYAMLPTLSGSAQERLTNATGFTGRYGVYALQLILSWRLDYGTYATAQAQAMATDTQRIEQERTRRNLEDSIFQAYKQVEANLVKSQSARAQAAAARKAAELASERYQAGASTQLDVTQAQRDAFSADANRIQADANLAYSRASLRIAAGRSAVSP